MARHRRADNLADIPLEVLQFDPAIHGQGDPGIERWRKEAVAWLGANPGRSLPCGGVLQVFRTARDLYLAERGLK